MNKMVKDANEYVDTMKVDTKVIGEHILCQAHKLGYSDRDSMIQFEREVWGIMARKFNMIEFGNMGLGRMVHIVSLKDNDDMLKLKDKIVSQLAKNYNTWEMPCVYLLNLTVSKDIAMLICKEIGNSTFTERVEESYI